MKKIFFIFLFFLPIVAKAQQHSDLWLKVQQIREEKYPQTVNNSLDAREMIQGVGYLMTPCIIFDSEMMNQNAILENHTLADIAGIVYLPLDTPTNECEKCATIYGAGCALGVILVYTKAYALAHPNVVPTFDYVFP